MTQVNFKKGPTVALLLLLVAATANAEFNFVTNGDKASAGGCYWSDPNGTSHGKEYAIAFNKDGSYRPVSTYSPGQCSDDCAADPQCTHWSYTLIDSPVEPFWFCVPNSSKDSLDVKDAGAREEFDAIGSACGYIPSRAINQKV